MRQPTKEVARPAPRVEPSQDGGRLLTREEIARSPELRRGYAREYREARMMVPDKEAAKDVARLNLSARVQKQAPVVTRELVANLGADRVKAALANVITTARVARVALTPVRVAIRAARSASQEMER